MTGFWRCFAARGRLEAGGAGQGPSRKPQILLAAPTSSEAAASERSLQSRCTVRLPTSMAFFSDKSDPALSMFAASVRTSVAKCFLAICIDMQCDELDVQQDAKHMSGRMRAPEKGSGNVGAAASGNFHWGA